LPPQKEIARPGQALSIDIISYTTYQTVPKNILELFVPLGKWPIFCKKIFLHCFGHSASGRFFAKKYFCKIQKYFLKY